MRKNQAQRTEMQRPHVNSNFLVDLGYADPQSFSGGFSEVIFPEFRINDSHPPQDDATRSKVLILKRGATGMLDLYEWWNKARRGKSPKERTVTVMLMAEDRSTVVLTWDFHRVRPVSLSYSPLNAMDGGVLIESIELAFDSMEMR